jgi:amidophosphoribosyltransferase
MGTYEELIAAHKTVEEICQHVGADSLVYLTLEHMMKAIDSQNGYCNACFTGKYPISAQNGFSKTGFENNIG